jgi:hypothetical protein
MRKKVIAPRRLHISNSNEWLAYLEHSAPLASTSDLESISKIAIKWAMSNNVDKVIVHRTISSAEVIYSA